MLYNAQPQTPYVRPTPRPTNRGRKVPSVYIKVRKMAENAVSGGFESNCSGAACCRAQPIDGILIGFGKVAVKQEKSTNCGTEAAVVFDFFYPANFNGNPQNMSVHLQLL